MLKASEIQEVETIGAMKAIITQMENTKPINRAVRTKWRAAIRDAKNALEEQSNINDSFMSVDDT